MIIEIHNIYRATGVNETAETLEKLAKFQMDPRENIIAENGPELANVDPKVISKEKRISIKTAREQLDVYPKFGVSYEDQVNGYEHALTNSEKADVSEDFIVWKRRQLEQMERDNKSAIDEALKKEVYSNAHNIYAMWDTTTSAIAFTRMWERMIPESLLFGMIYMYVHTIELNKAKYVSIYETTVKRCIQNLDRQKLLD